jgi:Na+/phosphate symporter
MNHSLEEDAMAKEKFSGEEAALIAPIVENLLAMMRAARDAFNRHSRERLQEMQRLQKVTSQTIAETARQVQSWSARRPEVAEKLQLRLDAILSGLATIDDKLGSLADPIQKKIKGGVLFSHKAVTQTNYLFDQHTGMIKSLLDIVKTDNQFLKNYVKSEGRNLIQACADFALEHQERLIEGLCAPQAAPIFLVILDAMQVVGRTEAEIARHLTE